jgi:MoaA/NifB/PqqE/SkfB family radical SAM enzyme
MDKIRIANWLLTRRCNLKCEYCGLVRDRDLPELYKPVEYYIENEMSTEYVITVLEMLKEHNPDCFHIFYGGEPLLRDDLAEIVQFCNDENIHYTIITNNTEVLKPRLEKLLEKVNVKGLSSSVDPALFTYSESDIFKKSVEVLNNLLALVLELRYYSL